MLPEPHQLGLPKTKFPAWRRNQPEAIRTIGEAATKFVGIVAPTGFGKSLMVLGHALHSRERVCILTSTKALQDQYQDDFGPAIVDIRGQNNYPCEIAMVTAAEGPCHGGFPCELRKSGCLPFDLKRLAKESQIVSTNYQFWMHTMRERVGLGIFDRVIMDEAHNIPIELSKFLATHISRHEIKDHLSKGPEQDWITWAALQNHRLTGRLKDLRTAKISDAERTREMSRVRDLKRKLSLLARADAEGWVRSEDSYGGSLWDCIHPGRYASRLLFKRADKFLLTSASIRPRTFQSLFISPTKVTFREYPSTFPVARRPIYVYGAIAYSKDSTEEEITYLVHVIDQWIDARLDRKGIIHSVSYERAELFKSLSKHKALFITHAKDELPAAVKAFKSSRAPRILCSPAIVEGHSFPYSEAEYVIVPKVPFGDISTEIHKARSRDDRSYGMLDTAVAMRQMVGRPMRADDDQCEALILDKQFDWFHRSYRRFFPQDFNESLKFVGSLPRPLPSLASQKIPRK